MSADALAAAYRRLGEAGLIVASAGNLSVRGIADMLISATGVKVETVSPAHMVWTDFDGQPRGKMLPSSEWHMHAAIYRAFPEAGAVVHTHADACTALACLNEPLPAFHYMLAEFGGDDVRCAPYLTFGTQELADAAVIAMEGRTACLLANHGMICHGPTLEDAVTATLRLESLVRQYLLASSVGTPRLLTRDEMAAAHERYTTYGQQPGVALV